LKSLTELICSSFFLPLILDLDLSNPEGSELELVRKDGDHMKYNNFYFWKISSCSSESRENGGRSGVIRLLQWLCRQQLAWLLAATADERFTVSSPLNTQQLPGTRHEQEVDAPKDPRRPYLTEPSPLSFFLYPRRR